MSGFPFDDNPPFQPPRNHHEMERLTLCARLDDVTDELFEAVGLLNQVWSYTKTHDPLPDDLFDQIDNLVRGFLK